MRRRRDGKKESNTDKEVDVWIKRENVGRRRLREREREM